MSEVTEQPDKDSVEVQFNIRPHPGEVNRCDAVCESILRCQSPDCLAAGPILIEEAGVRLRGHWHCCVWIIAIIAGALSIPFGLTMGLLRIFLISGELYKGNINGTSTSVTFDEALWYSLPVRKSLSAAYLPVFLEWEMDARFCCVSVRIRLENSYQW